MQQSFWLAMNPDAYTKRYFQNTPKINGMQYARLRFARDVENGRSGFERLEGQSIDMCKCFL